MAGGAEITSLAREGQKNFVLALLALDAGKAVSKIPTTQVLVDHISNDVSQHSESLLISLFVDRLEFSKVVPDGSIQRRSLRLSWLVDRLDHPVLSPGGSETPKTLPDGSSPQTRKPDSPRQTHPSDRESSSRPQSDQCSGRSFTPREGATFMFPSALTIGKAYRRRQYESQDNSVPPS